MVSAYAIGALRPDQIAQAYPLVQAAVPALDLASWYRMASDTGRQEEILVVANPRGYIQGLSICRRSIHPAVGPLLDVVLLIVASVADERRIRRTLLAALGVRAKEQRCARLRFWNQTPGNWQHMRSEEWLDRLDHGLTVFSNDEI